MLRIHKHIDEWGERLYVDLPRDFDLFDPRSDEILNKLREVVEALHPGFEFDGAEGWDEGRGVFWKVSM